MEVLACLNGEIMPVEQARVPVWDRGFLFGDAVYEVWRTYRGRCWLEPEHLARLRRSLKELEFPPVDLERLMDRLHRTLRGERDPGGDRLRADHARSRAPGPCVSRPAVPPTELIIARPYDDGPTARLREAERAMISHPDLRWKRCDVKSTNLLGNVLAMETARRAGCQEAVLVDSDGPGHRGHAFVADLGARRPPGGNARGARDSAGDDPAARPSPGRTRSASRLSPRA